MAHTCRVGVLSDIHYAGAAERARGGDYELRGVRNPVLRALLHWHRHFVWMRHPLGNGYLVDRFLQQTPPLDFLILNGDYSCDSAFIGVSDDAACASVRECLGKLRAVYGDRLRATIGDHELGKRSLAGGQGGMRLSSYHRVQSDLGLEPLWQLEIGKYKLIGITSSLVALPTFAADTRPEDLPQWRQLRQAHLEEIRQVFLKLTPAQKVLLFCHDPTALPFLWHEETIRAKLSQIEQTFIGHLHTGLVLRASRVLSAIPFVHLPGHSGRRMSSALREARHWWDFNLRLCPALAGIELLKDGGYWVIELDPQSVAPARYTFHPVRRYPRG